MNSRAWSVFHDGEISSVSGSVPGDLDVFIEAGYLRERFLETGNAFVLHVIGCDMISFKSFTTNQTELGVNALIGRDLEILSATEDGDTVVVTTAGGVLRIRYQSESLALDTGRGLQVSDVAAVADRALSDLTRSKA